MQPQIPQKPGTYTNWSGQVHDPYHGLRDKEAAQEVIQAEDDWCEQASSPIKEEAEAIAAEALAKVNSEPTTSWPVRRGPWKVYTTTDPEKEHPTHWVSDASTDEEELLNGERGGSWICLDENQAAEALSESNGWDVGSLHVTDAGKTWYTYCPDGSEIYTLASKERGAPSTDHVSNISPNMVVIDENTHVTVELNEQLRPWIVNLHAGAEKIELYREEDEEYWVYIDEDRGWFHASSGGHNDSRYQAWKVKDLKEGKYQASVSSEHTPGYHRSFLAYGENTYEIVDTENGDSYLTASGEEVYRAEDLEQIADGMSGPGGTYLSVRGGGEIRVVVLNGEKASTVQLPPGNDGYCSYIDEVTGQAYLRTESWLGAGGMYRIDGTQATLVKKDPIKDHDEGLYQHQRLHIRARDGEEIPVSLIRAKSTPVGGPAVAYVYGAYGISLDAWFSATRTSALNRGVTFVVIHARGGGENGRVWHEAGRGGNKLNTFTDVADAINELTQRGEVSKVALRGGSAGGGTVTAVANLGVPALAAVVAEVPFVDALATMSDKDLPLTVGEYPEWGNPQEEEGYKNIAAWSPIDNVKEGGEYPPFLITVGVNDPRVGYWEGLKLAAKVREANPVNQAVVRVDHGAGHQGASGIQDSIREEAHTWAWMLQALK